MSSSTLESVIVNSGPLTHLRFNGKNFNLWKMKMIAYMESLELHEVVETPIAETEEEIKLLLSNRVKGDNDISQSSKAYSILLNSFQDEQLQLVSFVTSGDAHGVWKVLLARYERKTTGEKHW